jgi:O-antigen ligase
LFLLSANAVLAAGTIPGVLAATAALGWLGCLAWRPRVHPPPDALPLLACFLAVYTAAAALPLPAPLASAICGAERRNQHAHVQRAIRDAAALHLVEPYAPTFALSRNRAGTMRAALLLLGGLAAAALASRVDSATRRRYLAALVIFATAIACLGFVSQWVLPQGKTIWWLFPVPHGRPVACFVNRNHFGSFVAMFCPAALVLCSSALAARRPGRALGWGLVFAAMTFATAMSLSRGAWVAYAAGMTVLLGAAVLRRRALVAAVVLVAGAAAVLALASVRSPALRSRAASLAGQSLVQQGQSRLATWRDSVWMLADYPLLGAGAEAFGMAFPRYARTPNRKSFQHAENDYVQFAVEYGLLGSALAAACAAAAAVRWRRHRLRESPDDALDLSVLGAFAVAGVHAMLDFPLHVPLFFLTLCSLAGLALPTPRAGEVDNPLGRHVGLAMPLAALALVGCLSLPGRRLDLMDSPQFLAEATAADLCRALAWSPTSWQAWYDLGSVVIEEKSEEGYPLGERCIARAAECSPANYELWYELGMLRHSMGDREGTRAAAERLNRLSSWLRLPSP